MSPTPSQPSSTDLTRPLDLGGEERGRVRRRSERLLRWLAGFDGNTWEQRWLASGADAAPRGWQQAAFPHHNQRWQRYAVTGGLYHLIQARVLRPSYAWLLLCRAGTALTRFLEVNAADQLPGLRALPAYQQALVRQRCDAEHCIARVMIRTGKPLDALTGEELLHYADIVRTSGRHRREHLAWELLVALRRVSPVSRPPCGRPGRPRATAASTPSPPSSTATPSHPAGSGTCSWTTWASSNPAWTTPP